MTDQEYIRKAEGIVAELVNNVEKDTPYRVLTVLRTYPMGIKFSLELKPVRQEVPVTGEVKS
jgi:hypothetical protein